VSQLPTPLRGIIPPLVTPLKDRDSLDVPGLERVIRHVLAGGVHGLFLLGTTGEGTSLSHRLRREFLDRCRKLVNGRVPLLAGITDTSFVETVNLARAAAEAGADAVVLSPPYSMPEGQVELRGYLEHILPELPLPLFLYNMPPLTKVAFELDVVRWALDQPRIVGMKDSSGSMLYFNRVREATCARAGWSLLVGPEELLAEAVLLGGHGGVCASANIFPRLYVELYAAAQRGDLPRARALHSMTMRVAEEVYRTGQHPSAIIKSVKCALSCLGLCDDFMAEPFQRFREPERRRIQSALKAVEPCVAEALGTAGV
jgi:4-hydroxy-tetrahydrodipicolinate synthase